MKKHANFISTSAIVTMLAVGPAASAQSTSGQTGQSQGTQPRSGTQSGQTTGSPSSGDTSQDKKKVPAASGEQVGADVPSAGTQTDQRGRTAASNGKAEPGGALKGPDRAFFTDAMEGNHAEIALAQLALQKADSAAVRDLAKMLQQEHQKAADKLSSIASKIGAADNEPALKPEHKQLQQRLSRLEGASFDAAYSAEMVKDHQKDIAKYETASRQLEHADLKAYATETLPRLKHHLEQARAAQSQASSPKTK